LLNTDTNVLEMQTQTKTKTKTNIRQPFFFVPISYLSLSDKKNRPCKKTKSMI